jgi:hypothetical protein
MYYTYDLYSAKSANATLINDVELPKGEGVGRLMTV